MTGILVVDKPLGWTSHDVVAKLRGILHERRIGHGGTLDPLATGVLPVFVGRATAAVGLLPDTRKSYVVKLQFGCTSPSLDLGTPVTRLCPDTVTDEAILNVLPRFIGEQMQLPPLYSAIKKGGEPLYKKARRGDLVEVTPRPVTIYDLRYLGGRRIAVDCGKGTYVRSLVKDIGDALGCPAIVSELRRTRSGCFTLADCVTLDGGDFTLLPTDAAFRTLPTLDVDENCKKRLLNGCPTSNVDAADGLYRAYCGGFLGLATVRDRQLTVKKLFCERT